MQEERILAELQEIKSLLRSILAHGDMAAPDNPRTLVALGWSREQAAAVRGQLASFEEDWNAPGMEAYDEL